MAALKRYRGTWVLILLLATGFFLLRERKGNAAPAVLPTLTINVATPFNTLDNGPSDCDPTVGVFEFAGNLTIGPLGSITCDDPGTAASACPIKLVIEGNVIVAAGGFIRAENQGAGGGNGGDITITAGGPQFTLCGPSSSNPDCPASASVTGAYISSQQAGGGNGTGGNILIQVGGVSITPDPNGGPAIGVCGAKNIPAVGTCPAFVIPANTGDALIEQGATIISNAASGHAGDIALYTGHNIRVDGLVEAQGFQGAGHGGAITLDACCDLLIGDTGVVSSVGRDPGPDRVHLEACTVTIYGLVQSTGPAHESPAANCTPPERPGKPTNSTACVEVWAGTTLTIDATFGATQHHGQINADVGFSGGASGHGWVDLLANGNIVIMDGGGNDAFNPKVPGPQSPFAVHANMFLSGDGPLGDKGGDILVMSGSGTVDFASAFVPNDALQANNTANGGEGGTITVYSGRNPNSLVNLDSSFSTANGGGGAGSAGGNIQILSSKGPNGAITGTGGGLSATNGGDAPIGIIDLRACIPPAGPISYSGAENPVAGRFPVDCPVRAFPQPADTLLPSANCAQVCQPITNTPTPTPTPTRGTPTVTPTIVCPEDPGAHLTRSVKRPGSGVPNYDFVQDAYNAAAANAGEVIGIFGNTVENVTLGDAKTLKITQCTSARITAANNGLPVWNITSTGKLTIQGPDSVGGTIGWLIANASGGPHTLKSVRANGASVWGIRINTNGNNVSWNDVSGNGPPGGILVVGNSNTLKGGDTGPNTGDGIKITGNSNNVSGATVESNTGNGVFTSGGSNQIKSIRANLNGLDGFNNAGGANNKYSGNSSNNGGKENTGAEYRFITAGVNGGSNRADGINVPSAAKCPTFPAAGTVCE